MFRDNKKYNKSISVKNDKHIIVVLRKIEINVQLHYYGH